VILFATSRVAQSIQITETTSGTQDTDQRAGLNRGFLEWIASFGVFAGLDRRKGLSGRMIDEVGKFG